jgi:hypothetical protein
MKISGEIIWSAATCRRFESADVSAQSKSAFRMPQGQLVALKSNESGRVALAHRTKLGEDGKA